MAFVQQGKKTLTAHIDILEALDTIDEAIFLPPADAAPPKPITSPFTISASVMAGGLIKKVSPDYPPIAVAGRVQGMVVLQATIAKNGRIENLRVIRGPALLQQAALDAVKQWVYRPYVLFGEPVEVETEINVVFTLGGR